LGRKLNDNRPVFLNLTQIRFPVTAIISILHRASGVFIFIMLPWLLLMLHASLASASSYASLVPLSLGHKFFLWLTLVAVGYHLIAGIRHMFMDLGFAESFSAGSKTAWVVLVLSAILAILLGVMVW
jgi:succinate dehydrogenase / fumarate reductase cytochrome b subunit